MNKISTKIILYYYFHKEKSNVDMLPLISEIQKINIPYSILWEKIISTWKFINSNKFSINIDSTNPSQIFLNAESLCLILGYELNFDGSMKQELINHLQVSLKSSNFYSKSLIIVTGGPTKLNKKITEGEIISKWLITLKTTQNTKEVYKILTEENKIKYVILITSDYHMKKTFLLYYTQFMKSYYIEGDPLIKIISNLSSKESDKKEKEYSLAYYVAEIMGVNQIKEYLFSFFELSLSKVKKLEIKSDKDTYKKGEKLNFHVVSKYESGYERDITDFIEIESFDNNTIGEKNIGFIYEEITLK